MIRILECGRDYMQVGEVCVCVGVGVGVGVGVRAYFAYCLAFVLSSL